MSLKTKDTSKQFGTVCTNPQTFPNSKIEYSGEKQVVDDLNTINKKDLTIILWAKVKEQQQQIDKMMTVIAKLTASSSYKEFKSS